LISVYEKSLAQFRSDPHLTDRLHPNITSGFGVPKAYFEWQKSDNMLCGYRDPDMCGNMFEMGVFDEAIRTGRPGSKIYDLPSARSYCNDLLGGRCDAMLPVTYHAWVSHAADQCGEKQLEVIKYDSPDQDTNSYLTKATFEKVESSAKFEHVTFYFFFTILLFAYVAMMSEELRDVFRLVLYVVERKVAPGCPDVQWHHTITAIITCLRLLLWMTVTYTGTLFLCGSTEYKDLIFDAVALVFIIQIDELLYSALLRRHQKDEHMDMKEIQLIRKPLLLPSTAVEILTIMFHVCFCLYIAYNNKVSNLDPLRKAYECLCSATGSECYEAVQYSRAWWGNYWAVTLPSASREIDALMAQSETW
jgi:hypothetical protein